MNRTEKAVHAVIDLENIVDNFDSLKPDLFQKYLLKHPQFRGICYYLHLLSDISDDLLQMAIDNGDIPIDEDEIGLPK